MSELIVKTFRFQGKRYYVRGKTEREAIMKMANKLRDLEDGTVLVSSSMLVKDWSEHAVEVYKTNLADISLEKYNQRLNHCIIEVIGHMKLKDVKPIHCQNCLNRQIGKSQKQINEVYQTLRFIFSKAQENGLINVSPAKNITKPKGYKKQRRAITQEEREHLLKVCDSDNRFDIFLFMLYCGCRPSEAREIKGNDLKLLKKTTVLHIRGTKTINANRIVPVPEFLYTRYKDYGNTYLFKSPQSQTKYNTTTYRGLCRRLYRAINISMGCEVFRGALVPPLKLSDSFQPYCLRHTYCTDLQKKGIDIRTAQTLMGHSDIKLTANIYTHVDHEEILKAAEILSQADVKILD